MMFKISMRLHGLWTCCSEPLWIYKGFGHDAKYPVVVQIVSTTGAVEAEQFIEASQPIDFIHLNPGKYFLRAVFDTNNNGRYDAGNFLLKTQPERVSYAKEILEVRAGWDAIEEFVLED